MRNYYSSPGPRRRARNKKMESLASMPISRPLSSREERRLLRQIRRGRARNRALITAQQFLGFRISEILALTIGHVLRDGKIREHVALPPRLLKGHYGSTRMVPVGPEFKRALEHYFK